MPMKTPMSKQSDIAVLGAGVMGLSAAAALLRRGRGVTIFDPAGFPARNASAMAGGMLAPYAEIEHMDKAWVAAGMRGIALWQDFSEGHDTGFSRRGSLLVAHAADRYILERFAAHLPPGAAETPDIAAIEPGLAGRFARGLFLPAEAHLDPAVAMASLCGEIARRGAAMTKEAESPENLAGRFGHVIDCRGMAAADPELRGVKGEILIARNAEFSLSRPVRLMHPRYPLYVVPRGAGVFMIGATQIENAEDEGRVSLRSAMELMSALYALHPSFGEAQIIEIASGVRPSYPDNLPRLSRAGNVIRAGGLFRHGWLLSPVMAESAADMIEERENPYISLFLRSAA